MSSHVSPPSRRPQHVDQLVQRRRRASDVRVREVDADVLDADDSHRAVRSVSPSSDVRYTPPPLYRPLTQKCVGSSGSYSTSVSRKVTSSEPLAFAEAVQVVAAVLARPQALERHPGDEAAAVGRAETYERFPHSEASPARLPVASTHASPTLSPGTVVGGTDVVGIARRRLSTRDWCPEHRVEGDRRRLACTRRARRPQRRLQLPAARMRLHVDMIRLVESRSAIVRRQRPTGSDRAWVACWTWVRCARRIPGEGRRWRSTSTTLA